MQMHFISTKYFFNYMWRKSYNLETNSFPLSENENRSFSIKVYFVQMAIKNLPIISNETVRCSLPEAFIAPRTVPTTEQHIPTNAIMTMNHRMETVWKKIENLEYRNLIPFNKLYCIFRISLPEIIHTWVTVTPQHDLSILPSAPPPVSSS